jgi:hypothetical protein
LERVNAADVDTFRNVRTETDGNRSIGMHLFDEKRAFVAKAKLGWIWEFDEDLLTGLVVEIYTTKVGASELFVNEELTMILQ